MKEMKILDRCIFKGSPHQFVLATQNYITSEHGLPTFKPYENESDIYFLKAAFPDKDHTRELNISAQVLPENNTLLFAKAKEGDRSFCEKAWNELKMELENQGWIDKHASTQKNSIDKNLEVQEAGRNPDPYYDLAYERISDGDEYSSVFQWYCEETKLDMDKFTRKNFKQAMRRRKTKEGTN